MSRPVFNRIGLLASAPLLLAVFLGSGCRSDANGGSTAEPDTRPQTAESNRRRDASSPETPKVPKVPTAPSAKARGDFDRMCLRRAAGIAGWRDYLSHWTERRNFRVTLPSAPADRPYRNRGELEITPGSIRPNTPKDRYIRGADSDAGYTPWSEEELGEAVRQLSSHFDKLPSSGTRCGPDGSVELRNGPRVQIVADRRTRIRTVRTLLEAISEPPEFVDFVVRNADNPPPLDRPRPKVPWVEEMLATYERTQNGDTRDQLLDDAIHRVSGDCADLRPALRRILTDEGDVPEDREWIELVGGCSCDDIEWTALESLVVWSLQPLGTPPAVAETTLEKLRDTDGSTTLEAFLTR